MKTGKPKIGLVGTPNGLVLFGKFVEENRSSLVWEDMPSVAAKFAGYIRKAGATVLLAAVYADHIEYTYLMQGGISEETLSMFRRIAT